MDHTVGQSPWLKHGHSQIRLYAIHLPFGPCRFSPTFRTSQGNGIAVAAVDQYAVCTVYLYHMFFLLCSYTWLLLFNMIFKTILVWNLSLGFFLAYPGPPRFLGRTSLALRDYWRFKLGTSNRSEIGFFFPGQLQFVRTIIYGTMFHWMTETWAHGFFKKWHPPIAFQ